MKKIINVIFALLMAMIFCVTGCNDSDNKKPDTEIDKGETVITLNIKSPLNQGEVHLHSDKVQSYLQSGGGVHPYADGNDTGYKGVSIKWETNSTNIVKYNLTYSVNEDLSDGVMLELDKNVNETVLDNLYKNTKYYLRLVGVTDKENLSSSISFTTSDCGPRPLIIDGVNNVRDLGGYLTVDGERTVQGMAYRGGSLSPAWDYPQIAITNNGKKYMSEVLKIKHDMDLRERRESGNDQSPIPSARIECYGVNGYDSAFSDEFKDNYKRVFKALAVADNYPVYIHCTGGADRTGTVAFLFNALLGVPENILIQDYEYTSFSIYGERSVLPDTVYGAHFDPFIKQLKAFPGETLKDKTANYLLSIGVLQREIDSIRAIMTGKTL